MKKAHLSSDLHTLRPRECCSKFTILPSLFKHASGTFSEYFEGRNVSKKPQHSPRHGLHWQQNASEGTSFVSFEFRGKSGLRYKVTGIFQGRINWFDGPYYARIGLLWTFFVDWLKRSWWEASGKYMGESAHVTIALSLVLPHSSVKAGAMQMRMQGMRLWMFFSWIFRFLISISTEFNRAWIWVSGTCCSCAAINAKWVHSFGINYKVVL